MSAGVKKDAGKAPVVAGCLRLFPLALAEVARISEKAQEKYPSYDNWQRVENGFERYTEALGRHLLAEGGQERDVESGMLHAGHAAWNALARLELKLRAGEK
jgi:hypothetical protein